jgi:hypothetical protein
MRRALSLALIAVAFLGVAVPGAYAQAPAPTPQVTITGFLDTVTSWSKNLQDSRFDRTGDTEWYARNRGRVDIIGALGSAKMVLGIEIDETWGQTGATDTINDAAGAAGGVQRAGTTSAFDLNTDTRGVIEIKWLYSEFPLPLVPFPTVVRIGAQPFTATYKLSAYASGDFAGVNSIMTFTPNVKWHFTYVALEENLTGSRRATGFGRGDDFALITSVEVTPIKGVDIRPLYSYFSATGSTAGQSRPTVGGIGGSPAFTRSAIGGVGGLGLYESRHTVGVDARVRMGPFSLDPTFFYQFGTRDTDNPFAAAGARNSVREADISAAFFDVIGGWRIGPLLVEGRYTYTTGNRPQDQLSQDVNYYQPLSTDTGFYGAGWGEILSLGIDYFNGSIRGLGSEIGFERYGRQQFNLRATYSVTPAFDVRGNVGTAWTARSVDTDGTTAFGGGTGGGGSTAAMTCATHSANSAANPRGAGCRGDESHIGVEANLGLTWRFAPGLTFDLVGAVLFAGGALDTSEVRNGVLTKREADNVYTIASRVRYAF